MHLLKYCLIESKGNHFYSIFLVLIIVFFIVKNINFWKNTIQPQRQLSLLIWTLKISHKKNSLKMHYFNSLSKGSTIPHIIDNIYIRTNASDVTEGPERYRLRLQ